MIDEICAAIRRQIEEKGRAAVAIDGGAASGKTTLGGLISERFNAPVIHMDDFFLMPHQRTAQRYAEPGGNIDYERFCSEVVPNVKTGKPFVYERFDCSKMALCGNISVPACGVIIVEGTYACHEKFIGAYDVTVFLDIKKDVQKERILRREKENAEMFFGKWIPLEDAYFSAQKVKEKCDLVFEIK